MKVNPQNLSPESQPIKVRRHIKVPVAGKSAAVAIRIRFSKAAQAANRLALYERLANHYS